MAKRRRSRTRASLDDVHRGLTAMWNYCRDVVDDDTAPREIRLKAVNSGNQVAMSLLKLLQTSEHEARLQAIEQLLQGQYEVTKNGEF